MGVGSYCVYQLSRQFFGKKFVWGLFNFVKCDLLARADSRFLHPAADVYYLIFLNIIIILFKGFYKVRIGEDDLQRIQKFFEEQEDEKNKPSLSDLCDNKQKRSVAFQRLVEILAHKNDAGLAAILHISHNSCRKRKSSMGKVLFFKLFL